MKTILLPNSWTNLSDLELKLLVFIQEEGERTRKSSLKAMNEWLWRKSSGVNNKGLKEAINKLKERLYIDYNVCGRTYNLFLTIPEGKEMELRASWILDIRSSRAESDGKTSIDWVKLLRVFLFVIAHSRGTLTFDYIASALGISSGLVKNSVEFLTNISFTDNLTIEKKKVWKKIGEEKFIRIGTKFDVGFDFN